MLVFKNKHTGKYVKRVYAGDESGNARETYLHVDSLEEASIFGGWWTIVEWTTKRYTLGFGPLPSEWEIIVIELVNTPSRKIIGHAG